MVIKKATLMAMPILMLLAAGNAGARVTLSYWEKWSGTDQAIIQGLIDKFNRSQSEITVKYLNLGGDYTKYLTACAAGKPPDLVGAWNHTLPLYVLNGVAEPLDSYLKSMRIGQKDLIPNYWDMMTYKGKVYGMPVKPASFAFFWNKGMFADAGLDPNSKPKTMEEVQALNSKLTKKDGNGKIKQFGYSPSLPGWYPYMWPIPFGADTYDEGKEKLDLTAPGMYAMLKWMKGISDFFGGPKGLAGFNGFHLGNTGPFISGKMAMDFSGTFYPSYLQRFSPKMSFGVGDLPYSTQGGEDWSWIEGDVVFLPKGGKHSKEAVKFLGWLMSQDTQRELNTQFETFSVLRGVNTPDFIKKNKNPYLAEFLSSAYNKKASFSPRTTAWNDIMEKVYTPMVNDVYNGKKAPEQAIKDYQPLANSISARAAKRNGR